MTIGHLTLPDRLQTFSLGLMRLRKLCVLLVLASVASAAPKPHLITFGKWTIVKLSTGPAEGPSLDLKVRGLWVDGKLKELTFGVPHEITDHMFVVQRIIRLNDGLLQEAAAPPRWIWQRGGWLVVDRSSGHISPISLPDFDPDNSAASWYRDYVAYCGASEDGRKLYAVVAQLGRRKPIVRKLVDRSSDAKPGGSCCPAPIWQRQPARVTFAGNGDQMSTWAVRGHAVEVVSDDDDGEEGK